ncbi:hypothetical protein C2845_PM02G16880 [Panicum miliaceum]|uniref:Uncharacterized protein n=1 Tax=Panicum miliaceum TaxID=4540 RepID=A0A3L6SAL3_PANMI|nr:hypothetical protein C2845_PM02G16880 [Panicum miliaceum]
MWREAWRRIPARASKPSGRPTTYQIRLHLRVLDQAALKLMPKSHTESKFNILHMYGKLRRKAF